MGRFGAVGPAVQLALLSLLSPTSPPNAGALTPIRVVVPATTRHPATPGGDEERAEIGRRVVTMARRALARAFPYRVPATSPDPSLVQVQGVAPDGGSWELRDLVPGGSGARFEQDGTDGGVPGQAVPGLVSIELTEASLPVRFERAELIADSAGAGQYRGGVSLHRAVRVLTDATLTAEIGHASAGPAGSYDGSAGRPGQLAVASETGEVPLPAFVVRHPLRAGDVVHAETAGGGGWGLPIHRRPEAVRRRRLLRLRLTRGSEGDLRITLDPETWQIVYVGLRPLGRGR